MSRQRGDTIIEVIFAVTVFSMVAIGGLALMNQGTAMAQRALEIELVRDQMDAQADALRYIHNAYIANYDKPGASTKTTWDSIANNRAGSSAQNFSSVATVQSCQIPTTAGVAGSPFALDVNKLDGQNGGPVVSSVQQADTYAKIDDNQTPVTAKGLWIQSVKSQSPSPGNKIPGYYDFHIIACWLTPGQSSPVTLGTIVRLYDPALSA